MPWSVFCGAVCEAGDSVYEGKESVRNSYTHAPCVRLVITSLVQKLNLVTSRRRPKHLSIGLLYFFMVNSAFRFSLRSRSTG